MPEADAIVSKGRFAELCNVSPGRVTQWITEGKITGSALVGEGRSAKIVVAVAQRQIRSRTDSGQAFGNGLNTKLNAAAPIGADAADTAPADVDPGDLVGDAIDAQIKRQRLEALQRSNRLAATEEAAKQGVYTETAAVRRQLTVVAVQALRVFEGAIPELSTKLAARFSLDEREVTLCLSELFRDVRAEAAKKASAAAGQLDVMVPGAASES